MNNIAFITGGAKRIGREMALALAKNGYDLAIHYNNSEKNAQECQRLIEKLGQKCIIIKGNLYQQEQAKRIIAQIGSELGIISLLINNAAVFNPQFFLDTDQTQFDYDMGVNLRAPFFLTQQFARQVLNNTNKKYYAKGDKNFMVVNMLDSSHTKLRKNYFLYQLSKDALYSFTLLAAKSLSPHIRVNAIAPGPVLAPPGKSSNHLQKVALATPLGIASPPDTIVSGLEYLLNAKTVTGQILYISSGMQL